MTNEQLQQRANLYARQAMNNHRVVFGSRCTEAEDELITAIARAFVTGFAAGMEENARRTRGKR